MFVLDHAFFRSTLLDDDRIVHGFSTRRGGVSTLAHTASMNVAEGRGDPDETVHANIDLLARAVSGGTLSASSVICAPQIHSANIRRVTAADAGTGVNRPSLGEGDGFLTSDAGILLMVRVADCVPILFSAVREDGTPLVAAVHAGWRGTAAGIAPKAVEMLLSDGAELSSIRCAVGQSIHVCCYEVGEDFTAAVADAQGKSFADTHIRYRDGQLFADLPGMNRELLRGAGLTDEQIDISPFCTACDPTLFHSHRASHGLRGTMGALIGIRAHQ